MFVIDNMIVAIVAIQYDCSKAEPTVKNCGKCEYGH